MNGTELRFNEIHVKTNTIQKRNRKIYLDVTNKCQHVIKDGFQTDQQGYLKIYMSVVLSSFVCLFLSLF